MNFEYGRNISTEGTIAKRLNNLTPQKESQVPSPSLIHLETCWHLYCGQSITRAHNSIRSSPLASTTLTPFGHTFLPIAVAPLSTTSSFTSPFFHRVTFHHPTFLHIPITSYQLNCCCCKSLLMRSDNSLAWPYPKHHIPSARCSPTFPPNPRDISSSGVC